MTSQPVSSILLRSPLPTVTGRISDLHIPRCCLPTSSSACLVFFTLSLCLARWFWQTWRTGDMSIPPQFASLYDGQEVFVWSDCLLDLGLVPNLRYSSGQHRQQRCWQSWNQFWTTGAILSIPKYGWCASLPHPSSCMLVNHGPSQRSSKRRIQAMEMRCCRKILRIQYEDHVLLLTRRSMSRTNLPLSGIDWWRSVVLLGYRI